MHPPHVRKYHYNPTNLTKWSQPNYPYAFNGYQYLEHPCYRSSLQYKAPAYHNNGAGLLPVPMHNSPYDINPYARQPSSDSGSLVPYGCHCAQCTHHAETGWSTFMDQGAMTPIQYSHPAAMSMAQPQQYGRHYREPHHGASPTGQHEMHDTPFPSLDAPSSGLSTSSSFTSETSEVPSLVAPPEVFGHPSPVPTLSDCSTRSISSGLRSSSMWGDFNDTPLYSVYGTGYTWSSGPATGIWTTMPSAYQGNDICQPSSSAEPNFTTSISTRSSSRCSPMEPRYNYQPQPQAANSNHIESINAPVTGTPSGHVSRLDEGLGTGHSRDQLLVHWKLAGMSYKEIKAKGRFEEAESTLRGRFRALTKDPGDRVRKPRWTKRDVRLLREGVQKLSMPTMSYRTVPASLRSASSSSRRKSKMQRRQQVVKLRTPWKEVAEYISEHGGSYHFGNATCRKKWDEVTAEDEAGVNNGSTDVYTNTDAGDDADGSECEGESIEGEEEVGDEEGKSQDD